MIRASLPHTGRFIPPTPLVPLRLDSDGGVEAAKQLGPETHVETLFPDRMERYF